ncbi:hypothetical protein ACJX0J_025890, partial [Zea mays]
QICTNISLHPKEQILRAFSFGFLPERSPLIIRIELAKTSVDNVFHHFNIQYWYIIIFSLTKTEERRRKLWCIVFPSSSFTKIKTFLSRKLFDHVSLKNKIDHIKKKGKTKPIGTHVTSHTIDLFVVII